MAYPNRASCPDLESLPYPESIVSAIASFRTALLNLLGKNLHAIYLYGSLAGGCHNAVTSDVDMVVVLGKPIDRDMNEALLQLQLSASIPIDATYITIDELNADVSPTPLQCVIRPKKLFTVPKGLTDFVLIRQEIFVRGVRLFGPAAHDLVHCVPWDLIRECELQMFDVALERFKNPVLMLCRIVCTLITHNPCTKKQAAKWALEHFASQWHPLLTSALHDYQNGVVQPALPDNGKAFKAYCRQYASA